MATVTDKASKAEAAEAVNAAIKDRQTIADHVCDWMANNCRSWSIDTLLSHPTDAIKMAKWVCRRMQRKPTDFAINEVCRAALASRKRGELKRDRD